MVGVGSAKARLFKLTEHELLFALTHILFSLVKTQGVDILKLMRNKHSTNLVE